MNPSTTGCIALLALLLLPFPIQASEKTTRHLLFDHGRRLELHISNEFDHGMQKNLVEWVDFIAQTLAGVYGHWPRQQWQVSIAPVSAATSDPVPWAEVHRGEPDRVEFFTLARASAGDLKQAWTGYHELAHLLIPYRGWGDAWFSEGLASYYQNVLQARAGVLSEQQMWQKLYDGYLRGRNESRFDGQDLRTVSSNMRREGGFMRVYWSGAWYFLVADARLRLASNGRQTLDLALDKLNACCAEQRLSVPQMVRKLDELNDQKLFQPLYDEVAASTRTPSYEPVLASLGIAVEGGTVELGSSSEAARLRRSIATKEAL